MPDAIGVSGVGRLNMNGLGAGKMTQDRATEADCSERCPLRIATDGLVAVPVADDATTDSLLGRRAFLSRGALAAAVLALAACSGVGLDSATGPSTVSLSVNLADYPTLAIVGGVALVTSSGVPLVIVRTGASSFVTLSRVCPHEGGIVGSNGAGGFTCPRHGAQFSSTGTWQGGQRTSNLRAYSTTFDPATGMITVG